MRRKNSWWRDGTFTPGFWFSWRPGQNDTGTEVQVPMKGCVKAHEPSVRLNKIKTCPVAGVMRPPASLHLSFPLSHEDDDDEAYQRACSEDKSRQEPWWQIGQRPSYSSKNYHKIEVRNQPLCDSSWGLMCPKRREFTAATAHSPLHVWETREGRQTRACEGIVQLIVDSRDSLAAWWWGERWVLLNERSKAA